MSKILPEINHVSLYQKETDGGWRTNANNTNYVSKNYALNPTFSSTAFSSINSTSVESVDIDITYIRPNSATIPVNLYLGPTRSNISNVTNIPSSSTLYSSGFFNFPASGDYSNPQSFPTLTLTGSTAQNFIGDLKNGKLLYLYAPNGTTSFVNIQSVTLTVTISSLNVYAYGNSGWQQVKTMYVHNGSTWQEVSNLYAYNGGWNQSG